MLHSWYQAAALFWYHYSSDVYCHLSDKQLRRFIDELKANGMLKTEGERGQMVYMIGDSYLENNALMNKALKIGLKELIDKGEISKGE